MAANSGWTVKSSKGFSASAIVAVQGSKYLLTGDKQKDASLYWVGAGVNVSIPGLPASAAVSTSLHFSAPGTVYCSRFAPCRINPTISAETIFGGNGLIIEVGINSALFAALGVEPIVRNWARGQGIQDWENQAAGQLLLFNTTTSLIGTIVGVGLADIIDILIELAATGDFSSIYTQGIAFVASTSTGIDSAGVTVSQGNWLLW